jgi:hypothetical protein
MLIPFRTNVRISKSGGIQGGIIDYEQSATPMLRALGYFLSSAVFVMKFRRDYFPIE